MRYSTGIALVLLAGFFWSTQGVILQYMTSAQVWTVMMWRSLGLIPAVAGYLVFIARRPILPALRSVGRSGFIGAAGLTLAFGGAIYALQTTSVASAVVLFAAAPFFAAILSAVFLREAVGAQTWAAIALATFGIAVMVGGKLKGGALLGNFAALCCALGFAIFTVSLRAGTLQMGGADTTGGKFPIVLLGGIFSAIIGFTLALVSGQALIPPAADIGIALFLGCVTLAGGMILYATAARAVPSAVAVLLSQIEVLLGPFWVWLFLGEGFGRNTAIGGGIVLIALAANAVMTRQGSNHS